MLKILVEDAFENTDNYDRGIMHDNAIDKEMIKVYIVKLKLLKSDQDIIKIIQKLEEEDSKLL